MRAFAVALVGFLASLPSASAATASSSFYADVVRRSEARKNQLRQQRSINDELLERAVPVDYYEKKYGVSLSRRRLNDYEMDENDMYSFSGYSLTFAKCQPVQYFSDEAVEMGSYSPMVTDDIVVLRLCPQNSCSNSKEYGCYYNYAEYAIELEDYMNIMLRYAAQKKEYMCEYCDDCLGGNNNRRRLRRLEDGDQEGEEEQNEGEEEQQEDQEEEGEEEEQQQENEEEEEEEGEQQQEEQDEEQQEQDNQQGAGDDAVQYDDAGDDYYKYACGGWNDYCSDYSSQCVEEDNNNGNNYYMDYEDYLNYLECSEVEYNGVRYYIKPRCDGYHNTIKMTVHYDAYCMQASGNDISVKNFGLGMRDSAFQDFYSGECVDCSESDYPPYDATSTMCNLIHYSSAQCVSELEYNPFENGYDDVDDTTECSYIESIRTGTYDESGTITLRTFGFTSEKITMAQKLLLSLFVALTVGLTVYACYLHHAMTNLLIKSLSHRELLPPSRHASRRASPRRTGRRLKKVGADSDWDDDNNNEFA